MPAPHLSCRAGTDDVRVDRLGRVEYQAAWDTQKAHAEARKDGGPDVLMLLEHPPVYTAGRRTRPEDRPTDGTPVVDVDRGGRITWHGPVSRWTSWTTSAAWRRPSSGSVTISA